MFSKLFKISALSLLMVVISIGGLTACDSQQPPELMKAVKQFDTDKELQDHLSHIRVDHMERLLHKRDETVYKGIRTKNDSLKACINCHVPEQHNGKVLRHTDPEHFCSTCHNYVATQLNCFQCHVDHPNKGNQVAEAPNDSVHKDAMSQQNSLQKPSDKALVEQLKLELAKNSTDLDVKGINQTKKMEEVATGDAQ